MDDKHDDLPDIQVVIFHGYVKSPEVVQDEIDIMVRISGYLKNNAVKHPV